MKYKHTQNLGWFLNGEKLKEQTINQIGSNGHPNDEKRVEQVNDL